MIALALSLGMLAFQSFAASALTQTDKRPHADKATTLVTGCVHGGELKLTKPDPSGAYSDTLRIRGAKKVMKALREHDGHEEELTGTLTEPSGKMGGGRSKSVGTRTKVMVGAQEDRSVDAPEVPQLDVLSFRHINSACTR